MAASTTPKEVAGWINEFIDDQLEEVMVMCAKIGEDALAISRQEHIYTARTGNLQSSCGFTITYNGTPYIATEFTPKPGENGDGAVGSEAGKQYMAECLENKLSKGITLIMVAGMDYAGYVEDWGGDVLKSAEAHIRNEFDKMCNGQL